jgi:hypothetical protein
MIQNLIDRYRMTKLDQLDWITRNRLLMKDAIQEISKNELTPSNKDKQLKILFWGVMPWERGGVEHMLATAMRARGHKVFGAQCSGEMSACSMESILYPRPDCKTCTQRHGRLLDIWGLNAHYQGTNQYLSPIEHQQICDLVDGMNDDDLVHFQHEGLPIGLLAKNDLAQYFFKLVDLKDPEVKTYYRRAIKGVSQFATAARKALEAIKPDRAVVTSGRTVAFTAFYQLCRQLNIPITTWDESIGGLGAFIFAKNSYAVNYDKPEAWAKIAKEPLTDEELQFNHQFFKNTAKGQFGRHTYYNNPIEDHQEILTRLKLRPDLPLTVLLTNLTWDTSALGKDVAFDSMIDWLTESIEFFKEHPERQLVIRTHPGEGHLAAYAKGCESVGDILKHKYPVLPPNIAVVAGKEEISSHQLAEMATTIGVYTTSVGLEMAMRGRRVLVCGLSHYRGKGFTVDVVDKADYFMEILNQGQVNLDISEAQMNLAHKYAYFFIVRTEVYLDEFNIQDRHQYRIENPKAFLAGESKRWDELCRNVEEMGDYVDCTGYVV